MILLFYFFDYFNFKCLSKGKLENFGRPIDLINDESSILHDLVFSLEKSERDSLIKSAEKAVLCKNINNIDNLRQ